MFVVGQQVASDGPTSAGGQKFNAMADQMLFVLYTVYLITSDRRYARVMSSRLEFVTGAKCSDLGLCFV